MTTIRHLAEDDIPAAVALFARVFPKYRWTSQAACESYLHEILFNNPWRELELPSWVAEENGRICGLYAVLPRQMRFRGRPIRVAVGCQFMVDPDRRHSLTALQLIKACLSGPQDLTFTNEASDTSRRMWIGIGGTAPLLYGLRWTRPLRPARYLLSRLEEHGALPFALTLATRPLGALVDGLAARLGPNRFHREESDLVDEPLDPATMLAHLPDVLNGKALQPAHDARSLAWLLDQTARKTRAGVLRARAVRDGKRRLIGWYLYHVQPGGVSEVVQLAAGNGSFDRVLRRLLEDAWRQGAAAVRGSVDPRFVQELSDQHCWCRWEHSWTLVHSRNPDIIAAINQGDALFGRLEGEWWQRWMLGE